MLQTTLLETLNKLPESLQQEVLHYAEFLAEKYAKAEPQAEGLLPVGEVNLPSQQAEMTKKHRQAGTMKGMFIMSDDFDEPLEEFKDYM